jgi:hypothetical protein
MLGSEETVNLQAGNETRACTCGARQRRCGPAQDSSVIRIGSIGSMFQSKAVAAYSYDVLVVGVDLGNALAQAAGQRVDRLL